MHQKAKYIPWILGVILLIIVVISVNELFRAQTTNKILQVANDKLSQEQQISEKIILAHDDSLEIYHIIDKELAAKRVRRKDTLKTINEEHIKNKVIIINDDAVAHVSAIGDIFRQYDSSY